MSQTRQDDNGKGTCKICKEDKIKNFYGLTAWNSGIYHDDQGKRWLGAVCPSCIKVMFRERRLAKKKRQEESPEKKD